MNKRAYRKAISKLSFQELRDALVREAELRDAATRALNELEQAVVVIVVEAGNQLKHKVNKAVRESSRKTHKPIKINHG